MRVCPARQSLCTSSLEVFLGVRIWRTEAVLVGSLALRLSADKSFRPCLKPLGQKIQSHLNLDLFLSCKRVMILMVARTTS